MREACRMTAEIRDICAGAVAPGVTTGEIDDLVADYCRRRNVKASFYKYMGFPGHLCVSLNDEVIHGIPSRNRVIMPGDLVKTDVGIFKNGFHGDAARSFYVGKIDPMRKKLIDVTKECFFKGPLELYKYINSFEDYSNLILLSNDSSLYPSDVNEYMHYFDLLISDYSSISTDFLVYDRPIVHFMYDIDSFENKNFTLNALETFQAGPICKSWEDLFKSIDEGLNGDLYSNLRMRARNNAFRYVDNNNCERVYKQICKILKLNDEQE